MEQLDPGFVDDDPYTVRIAVNLPCFAPAAQCRTQNNLGTSACPLDLLVPEG